MTSLIGKGVDSSLPEQCIRKGNGIDADGDFYSVERGGAEDDGRGTKRGLIDLFDL